MRFSLGQFSIRTSTMALATALLSSLVLSGCQDKETQVKLKRIPDVSYIEVSTTSHAINSNMQGRVTASRVAQVRPQISGIVQKRFFNEGSFVKKGQLLYQIDPATFQAAFNEAKANLNSAKASLETARLKDKRYRNLLGQQGISQQDADDARATFLEAQANMVKFQAALESAVINLEFSQIKATITGHIGLSHVTEGALVTAGQTQPLAIIRTLNPIYVDMQKSSADVLKLHQLMQTQNTQSGIKAGTSEVTLTLENGSTYSQKGKLITQELSVDPATGSVTLRAEFDNTNTVLLPGMFVRASVNDAIDEKAILVPQQGIYHNANGSAYAYVINSDNIIEKRAVETLAAVNDQWPIGSGL
ncbi:efflux RND transporter periplasmic adaptor subunit, partial [uncultured Pseudoalteromonas sp.]|uniref:efflux RND transporter periplasmic adaptor subunit n=1 Tax=uncultured Pseudoalteromonas sp. TaxID=114053 RepID=UPI0030FCFD11